MNIVRLPVVLCCAILFSGSCKKSSLFGLDILPSTDDVGAVYTDTFSLHTTTIRDDSVVSSGTVNNTAGSLYDPVFGKTYSAFFTEFHLATNDVDFGSSDTLFIDSIVLTLAYNGYYGYKDVPQTLNVFEVTEVMNPIPEGGYYSNKAFSVDPNAIGRKELFVPNFTDSVSVLDVRLPPHARIRLSDRFGQEILNQSGTSNLSNDSTFKQFFKGLCVAPDTLATPYGASILYFDLLSLYSGLHIYWHTPNVDSIAYVIPITSSEVRTNFFKHNYTNTTVAQHLQYTESDSIVFVQGMGGLKTRILIPGIDSLKNILVNKAELVITQKLDPTKTDSVLFAPSQIVCVTADSSGKDIAIPDNFDVFPVFGGGKVTKVTLNRETYVEYHFSIATQLQQIISGTTEDRGLFLIAYRRGETADRLVAGGNERLDNLKMKLILIYTPIP